MEVKYGTGRNASRPFVVLSLVALLLFGADPKRLAIAAESGPPTSYKEWKASDADVDQVEKAITKAKSLEPPLAERDRYYSGVIRDGIKFVEGVAEAKKLDPPCPGRRVIGPRDKMSLPIVEFSRGKCKYLFIQYNVQRHVLTNLYCM